MWAPSVTDRTPPRALRVLGVAQRRVGAEDAGEVEHVVPAEAGQDAAELVGMVELQRPGRAVIEDDPLVEGSADLETAVPRNHAPSRSR